MSVVKVFILLELCVCCSVRIHSIILVIVSLLFGLFVLAIGCDQVCYFPAVIMFRLLLHNLHLTVASDNLFLENVLWRLKPDVWDSYSFIG